MEGSLTPAQSTTTRPVESMPTVVRQVERVVLSGSGLQLPKQLPFERWVGIGRQLSAACTSAAWCLGDWLAFGQRAYADRYQQAIEQTSLDYQTLRNYSWVASRFALGRRRNTLSFGHHAEVAARPEPEQDYWLRKAEEHRWPVKRLRREIRTSLEQRESGQQDQGAESQDEPDSVGRRLQIRLSPAQLQSCQAAADKAGLSIEAWTIRAIDEAARHELGASGIRQLANS